MLSKISLVGWFTIIGTLVAILIYVKKIYRNKKKDSLQFPSESKEKHHKRFVDFHGYANVYLIDNSGKQNLNVKSAYVKKKLLRIFYPLFWRKVEYEQTGENNDVSKISMFVGHLDNFKTKIKTNYGNVKILFKDTIKDHQRIINKINRS